MTIVQDATTVLGILTTFGISENDVDVGRHHVNANQLHSISGIAPPALSDAVDLLEENRYATVRRALGTAPFSFVSVQATPRGRVEAERLASNSAQLPARPAPDPSPPGFVPVPVPVLQRGATPAGSPYGFTEQDWAAVAVDRSDPTRLIVCLGFQWSSGHYDSDALERNIRDMFEMALAGVRSSTIPRLDFRRLQGGYGSHVFNDIARNIIGSDVAVFDTSDLNPNVMIELGTALTWGVPVLPIRCAATPVPPSDISGQTWAEYSRNGAVWTDLQHAQKLGKLVEHVLRRKGAL